MRADVDLLRAVAGGSPEEGNTRSALAGLERFGQAAGLDRPHRFAHYLAQLAHESGRFRYDEEIWGPTPVVSRIWWKFCGGVLRAMGLGLIRPRGQG